MFDLCLFSPDSLSLLARLYFTISDLWTLNALLLVAFSVFLFSFNFWKNLKKYVLEERTTITRDYIYELFLFTHFYLLKWLKGLRWWSYEFAMVSRQVKYGKTEALYLQTESRLLYIFITNRMWWAWVFLLTNLCKCGSYFSEHCLCFRFIVS